jgi:hypothetical protein
MKLKRKAIGLLMLALLSSSVMAYADTDKALLVRPNKITKSEEVAVTRPMDEVEVFYPIADTVKYYDSVKGKVLEIKETDTGKVLGLGTKDEVQTHLTITNDTYITNNKKIKVGDVVTGYFESGMMHIMIYPARYTAEVLVIENDKMSPYVGVLDNELLTEDGSMIIGVSDKTKIVDKNGKDFLDDLGYKKVVIYYDLVRESYPAQVTPNKIVVLGEQDKIKPIENTAHYQKMSGKIVEIREEENRKFVSIVDNNDLPSNAIITNDTYIIGSENIKNGDIISIYFKAGIPMIMIYPPQCPVEVLVVEKPDINVHVGKFNDKLLSDDGSLILKNIEDVTTVTKSGKAYSGSIVNKKVAVMYDISTKSYPAQTTPTKIIVLEEEKAVEEMSIVVKGQSIDAPKAYIKDEVVMVPLRAISEALGFEVEWINDLRMVHIGKDIKLTIGQDSYANANSDSIKLGMAPEIINGNTFVPISFFREVVEQNIAEIRDNSIMIR